jgi:16S rRNA (guanine527-N7)-methyltransferase
VEKTVSGDAMARALASLDLSVPPAVSEGLGRYQPLLEKWSGRVRLVGRSDPETVAIRHFADSLTLLPLLADLPGGATVLDIGTGAGFPALPLALARPDWRFVLVESDGRKAAFLVAAVAALSLPHVSVKRVRAEGDPAGEGIGQAEVVVSRAFMAPEAWVALGKHYLVPGGRILAMMAAQAPDEAALKALGTTHGLVLEQRWAATLLDAGQRCVAVWRAPGPGPVPESGASGA